MNHKEAYSARQFQASTRLPWIDWMKTLGMFVIVWGHFFPHYATPILYAFSVQLFFFISGYVSSLKKNDDKKNKLKKIWNTLVIPYSLLCLLLLLYHIGVQVMKGEFQISYLYKSLFAYSIGLHSIDEGFGCETMWFVYTLLIIKLVSTYTNKAALLCISIIGLLGAFIYNTQCKQLDWAICNSMLGFPFYSFGIFIASSYQEKVCQVVEKIKKTNILLIILSSSALLMGVSLISTVNGTPWMYLCQYGNNLFLFLLSSFLGILSIFIVSCAICKIRYCYAQTISSGSILILALHYPIVSRISWHLNNHVTSDVKYDIVSFVLSIIIMMTFIPIIKIAKTKFPLLMGRRI